MDQGSAAQFLGNKANLTFNERELLTEFQQVMQFCHDPNWSEFKVEQPNPQVLTLYSEGLTKIFLSPELWTDAGRIESYFSLAATPAALLVLVGQHQQFAQHPVRLSNQHVQTLILPQTKASFWGYVSSLHTLQQRIEKLHVEREMVDSHSREVKYILSISRELNGERNIDKLLNLILSKAREITKADAGSIFTLERTNETITDSILKFHLSQNDSIAQNLTIFTMKVNEDSIVGKAVLSQSPINIPDLYKLGTDPQSNPWKARHDKSWDQRTGYESHSMLTLPIFDISHNVIGVIQLINRKKSPEDTLRGPADFQSKVIAFDEKDVEYALIVSQQAGIALENASLNKEILNLFDGFVNAAVTAIEQRDPTTSGHSHRVAELTMGMAHLIHDLTDGPFRQVQFSEDQFREIKYASLLHDFGKVGVRERVLTKAKKLYEWEWDVLMMRFETIKAMIETQFLEKKLQFYKSPNSFPPGYSEEVIDQERLQKVAELRQMVEFVQSANEPTVLEQESFDKLRGIANKSYRSFDGKDKPYLLSNELKALSVARGSLTREEFVEIQSHVTHTYEFLRKIPWGRRLSNVPQIAAKHHEKLDGSGYPNGALIEQIPVQTRIMTIADIFDALTASDRPYKKAVPVEKALDILAMDVKASKVDPDLFRIFVESKVYNSILEPARKV